MLRSDMFHSDCVRFPREIPASDRLVSFVPKGQPACFFGVSTSSPFATLQAIVKRISLYYMMKSIGWNVGKICFSEPRTSKLQKGRLV